MEHPLFCPYIYIYYYQQSPVDNYVFLGWKLYEKKWTKNLEFANSTGLYVSFYFPNYLSTIFIFSFTQLFKTICLLFF